MTAAVFDASVIVKLVVDEPGYEDAARAYEAVDDCIVPDWALLECAQAIWKKTRRREITPGRSVEIVDALGRLRLTSLTSSDLVAPAYEMAVALAHPVYDCLYLALAVREGAPLVTADARLRDVGVAAGLDVMWVGER